VQPCLAGPQRPQDRVRLVDLPAAFHQDLLKGKNERGFGLVEEQLKSSATIHRQDGAFQLNHGSVVIAAITSCTNTSNPSVMIGAGLLAKKAVEAGLRTAPWVKTSLAPGSRVVTKYLDDSGLSPFLEALRFHTVGYGCTTCIENSGPLPEDIEAAINKEKLIVSSVISGNRNFEGRVHSNVRASYLGSPLLVVAYALAGRIDIDFETESIGNDTNGAPVFLRDIWPSEHDVADVMQSSMNVKSFQTTYESVFAGDKSWQGLKAPEGTIYEWDAGSTYIQEPPFFVDMPLEIADPENISGARVLALLGDSITTDHISPAGAIPPISPAAEYLTSNEVASRDFNSFGSRRGNHEVMMRGTFGNVRLKNQLLDGVEGGYTLKMPEREESFLYDASMSYQSSGVPLIVLAGKEYGTGSSRDWAAKGTYLLGVKAVIAESYERIHRSNLLGMGVLPLEFTNGQNWKTLGLDGHETFDINLDTGVEAGGTLSVTATRPNGSSLQFDVRVRLDLEVEVDYWKNGGILQTVLRRLVQNK
jgi:aconitate hydratase